MGDPIYPGAQCTPAIEARQTLPERHVSFLQDIATPVGIHFVGAGLALQRVPVISNGALDGCKWFER